MGWIFIDLTAVHTKSRNEEPKMEFECELEIADTQYLRQHVSDELNFAKIARKLLINAMCVSNIVKNIISGLQHPNG